MRRTALRRPARPLRSAALLGLSFLINKCRVESMKDREKLVESMVRAMLLA